MVHRISSTVFQYPLETLFSGIYSDLIGFYSDLMEFYSDLMGFYCDLMEFS